MEGESAGWVWRRRGKVTQLVEYRWYPSMNMTEDLISILPAWETYGGSGESRMFRGGRGEEHDG